MAGQVYTLGYAADGAAEQLEQLMADPAMLLIDIRMRARSRWMHQWTKKQLTLRWGGRYIHVPQLGNVNYKDRTMPIELANPEEGILIVQSYLHQYDVVLLCACVRLETCHRRDVAALLAGDQKTVMRE